MKATSFVEKELAKLRAYDAKNQVVRQKQEASSDDRELVGKFYKALATGKQSELDRVNDLIAEDYNAKAQTVGGVGTGTSGGVLVPTVIADSVILKLKYISPMRQISSVIDNAPEKLTLPSEANMVQAYWVGESTSGTDSSETFDPNTLDPAKLMGLGSFSSEILQAAATNPSIQTLVENRFTVAMAMKENDAFVNGDGTLKPWGFRSSKITPLSVGQVGATLAYNDLTALKHKLPLAYRKLGVYVASDKAIQAVENLKDTSGRPIFREGLNDETPDKLLGRPVYEVAEIPENLGAGTDATEIWFGMFANYFIGDREGLRIEYGTRNDDFGADNISLRMVRRVGGVPVLSESFAKLTGVK